MIDLESIMPFLTEKDNSVGELIAKKFGLIFNGWWEDIGKYTFTDPRTSSTFLAIDIDEAKRKLEEMRKGFKRYGRLQPA